MVHFRHQLKCFSCYDIGVPNQIVTLHMSICVIFVLSYLSTYIYILLWANFWGMSFGFLVVLKIYNNCLWQIVISNYISTKYISTKFKMDCGGIISEYSNILCWNRRLIWGIILVCQNHLNIINNDRNLLTSKVFSAFFFFLHTEFTPMQKTYPNTIFHNRSLTQIFCEPSPPPPPTPPPQYSRIQIVAVWLVNLTE